MSDVTTTLNLINDAIFGAGRRAAAICAYEDCGTRELPYANLRKALVSDGVYLEN